MSIAITIIWAVFIGFWIISGFKAKKNVSHGEKTRAILIAFFLAMFMAYKYKSVPPFWDSLGPMVNLAGVIIAAGGLLFAIWARVTLGKNWGMPMSLKANPELVTGGPYAYVRHPIYTGLILMFLGSALVMGSFWFISLSLFTGYFIYSALKEERIMAGQFPGTYPAYKARTKMLIPFIF
jgi:protein-S-isoprenylcysteine O-methyltransferase Ste14